MNCERCGTNIPEENPACPNCGLPRFAQHQASRQVPPPPPPPSSRVSYIPPGSPSPDPVRNYIVQSLLVTICCCMPFGVIALIFSAVALSKQSSGDLHGAREAASKARMFCWLGFIVGVVFGIIMFAIYGASSFLEAFQHMAG